MTRPATAVATVGKIRSPWKAWGLFLLTLSFYDLYWWHQVNRELRDHLRDERIRPWVCVVAMYVPVANVVTLFRCGRRIRQAQTAAGLDQTCSGWLGVLLTPFGAMSIPYYQGQLNRVWKAAHSPQTWEPANASSRDLGVDLGHSRTLLRSDENSA